MILSVLSHQYLCYLHPSPFNNSSYVHLNSRTVFDFLGLFISMNCLKTREEKSSFHGIQIDEKVIRSQLNRRVEQKIEGLDLKVFLPLSVTGFITLASSTSSSLGKEPLMDQISKLFRLVPYS
jgi:hypothetical protein